MDGPRECSGCKRTWLFDLESDFDAHEAACLAGGVKVADPMTGDVLIAEYEPTTGDPVGFTTGLYNSTSMSTGFAAIRHLIVAPRHTSTAEFFPETLLAPTPEMIAEAQREEARRLIERERLIKQAAEAREQLRQRQVEAAERQLMENLAAERERERQHEILRSTMIADAAKIEADCFLCAAFRELKDWIDLDGTAPSRCLDCMERTAKARGWITDAERHEWEERKAVVNALNERINKGTAWEEFVEWWNDAWDEFFGWPTL